MNIVLTEKPITVITKFKPVDIIFSEFLQSLNFHKKNNIYIYIHTNYVYVKSVLLAIEWNRILVLPRLEEWGIVEWQQL